MKKELIENNNSSVICLYFNFALKPTYFLWGFISSHFVNEILSSKNQVWVLYRIKI